MPLSMNIKSATLLVVHEELPGSLTIKVLAPPTNSHYLANTTNKGNHNHSLSNVLLAVCTANITTTDCYINGFDSPLPFSSPTERTLRASVLTLLLTYVEKACAERSVGHLWIITFKSCWLKRFASVMGFDTCLCTCRAELVNVGNAKVKLCKALGSVSGLGHALLVDYGVDEIDEGDLIKQEDVEEGEITAAETVAEDYAGKSWLPKEQHAANKKRMAEENLAAPYQRDKRRVEGTSTYHVGNRLAAAIASANNVDATGGAVVLFDTNSASVAPVEPIIPITEKTWCTHWIRTGTCSFTQQGCLYIHEMPSPVILASLGFREVPRWYREKQLADQLAMIDKASIANIPSIKQEDSIDDNEKVSAGESNPGRMYCIYWVKMGRCDFTKQGCRYLHEMPSPTVLAALGFPGTPAWYLDTQKSSRSQLQLPPSRSPTPSQALIRADGAPSEIMNVSTQHTTSPSTSSRPPLTDPTTSSTLSHHPRSTHTSSSHPDPRIHDALAYCTIYLRLGVCNAVSSEGCPHLHTRPPRSVFAALGYADLPKWYTTSSSIATIADPKPPANLNPTSSTPLPAPKEEANHDTKTPAVGIPPSRSSSASAVTLPSRALALPPRPPPPSRPPLPPRPPFAPTPQPSPPRNLSTPKSHCTHYLRTGHCSFSSQGQRCRFSHIFPTTRAELLALGFKCLPRWYVEHLALQGRGPPQERPQQEQLPGPSARRDDALPHAPTGLGMPPRGSVIGGSRNAQTGKVYCNHFLKTGECDYMQTGCAFLHEYPPDGESPFTS